MNGNGPPLDVTAAFDGLPALGRRRFAEHGAQRILDRTTHEGPACLTWIVPSAQWSVPTHYTVRSAPVGGFLLCGAAAQDPQFWLPQLPRRVQFDTRGRLLLEEPAVVADFEWSAYGARIEFDRGDRMLEAVLWRLPPGCELRRPLTLETSAWYTLGSHTVVQGRVSVYRHLVGGTVFENRPAWPNQWRVFSENDAHALHLILGGLAVASGDPMLTALRRQLLLAVIERQSADGGFRHGEWTELMESHYRLHCSAMHLMMDSLAEAPDATVKDALRAAAAFMGRQAVTLDVGQWLLHDELEHSVQQLAQGPFKWVKSTALGKSESNMLVLNSHLDATIALDRYAQTAGDSQYAPLVSSARRSAAAVLTLRSAQPLYRLLFALIALTFLPAAQAAALPLWQRALKRLTWKYLIPRLPDIKARWPRLVMPGGYIDRELTLRTFAHDYHAINLMDLARYLRRFPDEAPARRALLDGMAFTRKSGLLERWREMPYQRYALGFWAEALYHVCTLFPDATYRVWLAEAMQVLEDLRMGQPPSLLGANAEAVPPAQQLPCPSPSDARLRIANLGRRGAPELLIVNASHGALPLVWEVAPAEAFGFHGVTGPVADAAVPVVPARSWLWARAAD